jgi:hypothetical protein
VDPSTSRVMPDFRGILLYVLDHCLNFRVQFVEQTLPAPDLRVLIDLCEDDGGSICQEGANRGDAPYAIQFHYYAFPLYRRTAFCKVDIL